jgi:hypothetical protein
MASTTKSTHHRDSTEDRPKRIPEADLRDQDDEEDEEQERH